mgnify:CR=1 FL=1
MIGRTIGKDRILGQLGHRALRATLESARADAAKPVARGVVATPSSPRRVGVLRVIAGTADQDEYSLDGHTSLIGRSNTALVRLRGWFKPSIAVAIAKHGSGYVATAMGGKPLANQRPLEGGYNLQEGAMLTVSGLVLEFAWKEGVRAESAA